MKANSTQTLTPVSPISAQPIQPALTPASQKTINLSDYFQPRDYQKPILEAFEKGYKKIFLVMPRRSGKDVVSFWIMFLASLQRRGTYFYIFPTFAQAKRAVFSAMMISGKAFIDLIPKELISSVNVSELKITLVNKSIIQFVGSENCQDRLAGTNPLGVVLSEYAMQNPIIYSQILLPILRSNDGFVIWESTPRGRNHFYDLFQIAKREPDYFDYFLTLDDTKHIDPALIRKDIKDLVMSEDLALQEYWCSFSAGVEGSFYSKYIDKLRIKGQICDVLPDPGLKVHTAWDIGRRDANVIIFFNLLPNGHVHIIDCIEGKNKGMEEYIKEVNAKDYIYGTHIGPHDLEVHEYSTNITRVAKARALGFNFRVLPKTGLLDGIEQVRTTLPRCFFNEKTCARLIKGLEQYRKIWNSDRQSYDDTPYHDWCSHFADAFRYLSVGLHYITGSITSKQIEDNYREARYGYPNDLPGFFRNDNF